MCSSPEKRGGHLSFSPVRHGSRRGSVRGPYSIIRTPHVVFSENPTPLLHSLEHHHKREAPPFFVQPPPSARAAAAARIRAICHSTALQRKHTPKPRNSPAARPTHLARSHHIHLAARVCFVRASRRSHGFIVVVIHNENGHTRRPYRPFSAQETPMIYAHHWQERKWRGGWGHADPSK